MPTYQYACTSCGHQFEAVQSFSDAALTECPECGSTLRKVYSAVGIVFKGSGFYRTDSRDKTKSGSLTAAQKESTSSDSSSSTTSSTSSTSSTSTTSAAPAKAAAAPSGS